MKTEIDPHAGFCFGVAKAIDQAEVALAKGNSLHCLGEIVHNEEETARLTGLGLHTIDSEEFRTLKNKTVLIRAHGEPPETYAFAQENNITLIEATCPVVLKLQVRVKKAWEEMKEVGGTVIIAGKRNHPEVIGLSGQTSHEAVIAESAEDLQQINFRKPVRLFAQTTIGQETYDEIRRAIRSRMPHLKDNSDGFRSHNSICGQVSGRVTKLEVFCKSHDVIIFVSGKNSSNGRNLFKACLRSNPNSYHISTPGELESSWFRGAESVGISGATSTPQWLMEKVAKEIKEQNPDVPETN